MTASGRLEDAFILLIYVAAVCGALLVSGWLVALVAGLWNLWRMRREQERRHAAAIRRLQRRRTAEPMARFRL